MIEPTEKEIDLNELPSDESLLIDSLDELEVLGLDDIADLDLF